MPRWLKFLIITSVAAFSLGYLAQNFISARRTSATNTCINNLRQIDGAKQQWAMEKGKTNTDIPTWTDLSPYIGRGDGDLSNLRCPAGGTYRIRRIEAAPACSIGGSAHSLN
jgi:hypothetical protein